MGFYFEVVQRMLWLSKPSIGGVFLDITVSVVENHYVGLGEFIDINLM